MAKQNQTTLEASPNESGGNPILANAQNELVEACTNVDLAAKKIRETKARKEALQAQLDQADKDYSEAVVSLQDARNSIARSIDQLAGLS